MLHKSNISLLKMLHVFVGTSQYPQVIKLVIIRVKRI